MTIKILSEDEFYDHLFDLAAERDWDVILDKSDVTEFPEFEDGETVTLSIGGVRFKVFVIDVPDDEGFPCVGIVDSYVSGGLRHGDNLFFRPEHVFPELAAVAP